MAIGLGMRRPRKINPVCPVASALPKSLLLILVGISLIPAIAYGALQYLYPADPDIVYTQHDKLIIKWHKFAEAEDFTEYLGKEKYFDEEALTADILVLRNYKVPQETFYKHERVRYASTILHQTVICRSRTVQLQDLMMFTKQFSKGNVTKDLYDLDWDKGEAAPGSIDELKVSAFCGFMS